ncbi:hypothetical protein MKX01_035375 [Papaver californicum]|nr:hypothetical protein MKX01_035375 [Papaver californicum]
MEMGAGGNRDNDERQDHNRYQRLYKAAKEGNWRMAEDFISEVGRDIAVEAPVTLTSDTALHIAASEGHSKFVEQLVILMTPEQLENKNIYGDTALQMTVLVGNIESVIVMVEKNEKLTRLHDEGGRIPIVAAADFAPQKGKKNIIKYLYSSMRNYPVVPSSFSGYMGGKIICSIIGAGFYDVAWDIIKDYPDLALERQGGYCALEIIAGIPNAFLSEYQMSFWDNFIYSLPGIDVGNKKMRNEKAVRLVSCIFEIMSSTKNIYEIIKYFSDTSILKIGLRTGAIEFLMECLKTFPGLIWISLGDDRINIFSMAIMQRQENIFNLVYHINGFQKKMTDTMDCDGNTILHLAAKCNFDLQTNQGYCIALQIQRELQWFQCCEGVCLKFMYSCVPMI